MPGTARRQARTMSGGAHGTVFGLGQLHLDGGAGATEAAGLAEHDEDRIGQRLLAAGQVVFDLAEGAFDTGDRLERLLLRQAGKERHVAADVLGFR